MSDIHDRGRAMAIRMLAPRPKGKGVQLAIISNSEEGFEPELGEVAADTAVKEGSGLRISYEARHIDGTIIKRGDWKVIVSPVLLNGADMPEPKLTDTLEILGDAYQIINVDSWNYAGVQCGYELQARRA